MRVRMLALASCLVTVGSASGKERARFPMGDLPAPTSFTAEVLIRDDGGRIVRRLAADIANGQTRARAMCVYAATDPMPDTLAFLVTVGSVWQMHAQLKQASEKPIIDGLTLMIGNENKSSVTSWTGGHDACDVAQASFDGTDADLSIKCKGVGMGFGAAHTLEAAFHMEACPEVGK